MMYRQIPSKNLVPDVRTVYYEEDIWSQRDTRQSRANHDDKENRDDIQINVQNEIHDKIIILYS